MKIEVGKTYTTKRGSIVSIEARLDVLAERHGDGKYEPARYIDSSGRSSLISYVATLRNGKDAACELCLYDQLGRCVTKKFDGHDLPAKFERTVYVNIYPGGQSCFSSESEARRVANQEQALAVALPVKLKWRT